MESERRKPVTNWIATWCKQRCSIDKACDRCYCFCLPRLRVAKAVGCSEQLLWMLMNEHGCVTHPNIANAIADYMCATQAERDSIVAPKHRGTWTPRPGRISEDRERGGSWNSKGVVALDRLGQVIARFPTIKAAARHAGCSPSAISYKCNKMHAHGDEFKQFGMAFRFEADWELMSPEEQLLDISKKENMTT